MQDNRSGRADQILVGTTLMLVAVYLVISVVLGIVRPDYSLIGDFESDYGRGRFSWLMDIAFMVRGVLSITALIVLLHRHIARRWTAVLYGIWAIASALLAFFPTDVDGLPPAPTGPVHAVLAGVAFLAGTLASVAMSIRILRRHAASSVMARGLMIISLAGIVFFLGQSGAPALGIAGLNERLFLLTQLVWIVGAVLGTRAIPGRSVPGGGAKRQPANAG